MMQTGISPTRRILYFVMQSCGCCFAMKICLDATLILVVISVCIAVDQATKGLARKYLAPDGFVSFAGDTFRLQYAENTGAFLSLGSSLAEPWRHIVFTVLVGIFLLALLAFVFFHRS